MLQRSTNWCLEFADEMRALRDDMMRDAAASFSPITLRTRKSKARTSQLDPLRCYLVYLHDSTVLEMVKAMRLINPADRGGEFTDEELDAEIIAAIKHVIEDRFPPDPPMNRSRRRRKK